MEKSFLSKMEILEILKLMLQKQKIGQNSKFCLKKSQIGNKKLMAKLGQNY